MREPIVIVGLGNPGKAYARTRHNAGFDVVDILAQRWGWKLSKLRHRALLAEGQREGIPVVLAMPQTFMNDSGASVVALSNWYKLSPARLIVAYDDVDLPVGRLRIRAGGGAGTHNGMRSILYLWGREDFPRVRIGIGAPPPEFDIKDWVLSRRTDEELQPAFDALCRAADALEEFIASSGDIEKIMRTYNVKG